MSFHIPGSKSQATKTARMLRAIAADLRNAATGFEQAAAQYQVETDPAGVKGHQAMKDSFFAAEASFDLARGVLNAWKTK